MYTIGEFSKKTGLTIRALRFYDEKKVLLPAHVSDTGRRFYDDNNIITAQKIMAFKYLDFSLEEIKTLLHEDQRSIIDSLRYQKALFEKKRMQIEGIIMKLEYAIEIGERTNIVDIPIFISVIHNLLKDDEQKAMFYSVYPKELVDKIYRYTDPNIVELNIAYMNIAKRIKQAFHTPLPDEELYTLFTELIQVIPQDLLKELIEYEEKLKEHGDLFDNESLFPSPLTPEEELWFASEMERLNITLITED